MISVTRRWWLLAIAGSPIVLGITAQALSVRMDKEYLRVSAPNLQFLDGKPLERLKNGNTVNYLGQLTVSAGADKAVQARSVVYFALSYDIWIERFKVTVLTAGMKGVPPTVKNNLTREAAQAWCLEQLKVDLAHVPIDHPVWVRLEMRSEDPQETAGIIGEPGISISGLVAWFSRPVKDKEIHVWEEISLNLSDLRKARP
jgi:hypothetical protein